ncbi:MAG: hypothetical protein LBT54_00630, partial [Bifidobacteriaceae bacterium]|nr:hypothetical protein [Bifidobacteriaceae bacterium]
MSLCPVVKAEVGASGAVGQAGGALLVVAARASGLDEALEAALGPWRKTWAVHHPAKAVLGLAITCALGGDCLADIALVRSEPGVVAPVASDPTVWPGHRWSGRRRRRGRAGGRPGAGRGQGQGLGAGRPRRARGGPHGPR